MVFRKKESNTNSGRRSVQRQPSATVFSYYSSRPRETRTGSYREAPLPPQGRRFVSLPSAQWLQYAPTLVAIILLVACVLYLSTLNLRPKLHFIGPQHSLLLNTSKEYQSEIETIFHNSLFNYSKILIDTNKIAQDIQSRFPELGEVSVFLPLAGRRPIVQLQPTRPVLTLSGLNGVFVIDERGRAIAKAQDVQSSIKDTLAVVQDESGLPLERGKPAIPREAVAFITEVTTQLRQKNLRPQSIILPTTSNELHIRMEGQAYFVKFDLRGEGRLQAGTYLAVQQRLTQERKVPGEYIDVRVPEKAFYR